VVFLICKDPHGTLRQRFPVGFQSVCRRPAQNPVSRTHSAVAERATSASQVVATTAPQAGHCASAEMLSNLFLHAI
jgi:hypothetical protein